ncbi:Mitochondrial fission factor [Labeo rohita]|uniref:Mitochondrial fission factor n=1 Tax=Labeo rohita TaxID=84645 RepID=A0ABQ8M0F6_LABRO|nr:Mitochondrial fission factor [Labeo rohita]
MQQTLFRACGEQAEIIAHPGVLELVSSTGSSQRQTGQSLSALPSTLRLRHTQPLGATMETRRPTTYSSGCFPNCLPASRSCGAVWVELVCAALLNDCLFLKRDTKWSDFTIAFHLNVSNQSVDLISVKMSGAAFPSPTAEMAEMNRIHYELEYTEGISQRMRIPEQLKFPRDLDLIQSTPMESTLSLKTPPRVLTLNERPLDFLEMEQPSSASHHSEVRAQTRTRRERSVSENTGVHHNGQLARNDSIMSPSPSAALRTLAPLGGAEDGFNLFSARGVLSFIQSTTRRAYQQVLEVLDENQRSKPSLRGGSTLSNPQHDNRHALATLDTTLEGAADDMALVDATSLRRQIVKLNRRLQLLEEENKERVKREMIMYSITVAFWLVNSWVWFRR